MGSKPARTISGCAGRCLDFRAQAVYREQASKVSLAALQVLPEVQEVEVPVADSAVAVAAEVVGSEADAGAAVDSAVREVSAAGREATANSLAIARIADARVSTATFRSNGRAPTPMPSSSH